MIWPLEVACGVAITLVDMAVIAFRRAESRAEASQGLCCDLARPRTWPVKARSRLSRAIQQVGVRQGGHVVGAPGFCSRIEHDLGWDFPLEKVVDDRP
jgi:hypothetical protein